MRALYPGSFDPLTLGHLDLIERGCSLFGEVVVAVLQNPGKSPAFSLDQRLEQITQATSHLSGVTVTSFNGLTVNCARQHDAALILRGLRAMSDFEYELRSPIPIDLWILNLKRFSLALQPTTAF